MGKELKQTGEYIDLNKILGYNRSIYMILTDRGFGKTYAVKKHVINQFLKNGKKFIYLRRYKPELSHVSTFFDDIVSNGLFEGHTFKVKGWNFYIDNKLCGKGMILSRYQDYKGGAFPDYDTIIFDEFLREKVKSVGYLNNDVEAFLSITDSVFRKRKGVKAILLSNTVNEVNPYFIDFKINRLNNSEYSYSQIPEVKDNLLCYIRELDKETIQQSNETSNFRQILGAIEKYATVSISNDFSEDTSTFIKKKSKNAKFICALKLSEYDTFGVWFDYHEPMIYITRSYEKTTKKMYVFDKLYHNENTIFVHNWKEKQFYSLSKIVSAFKQSMLSFENVEIKMKMFELFSKMRIF